MKKPELSTPPPKEVVDAVILIENWTSQRTNRDDWAIGGIACRKGFERIMKELENVKRKKIDF